MDANSLREPPNLLLAIDPGKATGYSFWKNARPAHLGIVRGLAEMDDWLIACIDVFGKPDIIIIEKYSLFSWKAKQQSGSDMPASQVIGKVEMWAKMHKIPVVYQKPDQMHEAVKWSKVPIPANHDNSHDKAALNHAVYYLVTQGMMLPIGLQNATKSKTTN